MAPLGARLSSLKAPVVHKHVVQHKEPVARHIHLVRLEIVSTLNVVFDKNLFSVLLYLADLCISRHSKTNESLIEYGSLSSRHIQRLILIRKS
jgi:hypothetical protein